MRMLRQLHGDEADALARCTRSGRDLEHWEAKRQAAFFRQILQNSPTPILVMDATPVAQPIVYANPAFTRLLGYSREEVVGRDWRIFLSAPGAQGSRAGMQTPHLPQQSGTIAEETRIAVRKDGTLSYLHTRLSAVRAVDGTVMQYVAVLHDVTVEHRLREGLEYRACHDPLTGLANRYLLRDRFEQAMARARRHTATHTLTLLDLDGFKQINDRYGHAVGDQALVFFGTHLQGLVRSEDTAARLGGDEFVLLLVDADRESSRIMLHRLHDALAAFRPPGLAPLGLSCSAGVAQFPDDGTTLEQMLEVADKRMYGAKI